MACMWYACIAVIGMGWKQWLLQSMHYRLHDGNFTACAAFPLHMVIPRQPKRCLVVHAGQGGLEHSNNNFAQSCTHSLCMVVWSLVCGVLQLHAYIHTCMHECSRTLRAFVFFLYKWNLPKWVFQNDFLFILSCRKIIIISTILLYRFEFSIIIPSPCQQAVLWYWYQYCSSLLVYSCSLEALLELLASSSGSHVINVNINFHISRNIW